MCDNLQTFPQVARHCRFLKKSSEHSPAAFAAEHAGKGLRSPLQSQSEDVFVVLREESEEGAWMILLLKAGTGMLPPAMVFSTNAGLSDPSMLYKVR